MKLTFAEISSIGQAQVYASVVETICFFRGEFTLSDLQWDSDELTRSYIDSIDDEDQRDELLSEPLHASTLAQECFTAELLELLQLRSDMLGEHYPFLFDARGGTFLLSKSWDELDHIGLCYIWLAFYKSVNNPFHFASVAKAEKAAFEKIFSSIFEIICCFALSGRGGGPVWYMGKSRSLNGLRNILNLIALEIPASILKDVADLQPHQRSRNDLGIDAVALSGINGVHNVDSQLLLVGATIQKEENDIYRKIKDHGDIQAFKDFFLNWPRRTYAIALAVPHDDNDTVRYRCTDKNCDYIHFDRLIDYLGRSLPLGNAGGNMKMAAEVLNVITNRAKGSVRLAD